MPEYDMLEEAEFENQLTALGDDQLGLTKFNARQTFKIGKVVASHSRDINNLKKQNKKAFSAVGLVSAALVTVVDFIIRRSS